MAAGTVLLQGEHCHQNFYFYSLAREKFLNKLRILTDIRGSVSVEVLSVPANNGIAQIIFMSCMKCIIIFFEFSWL